MKYYITLFLSVIFTVCMAQQKETYSLYMFNGQYANPAYTGSTGTLSAVGIYRHQWVGFDKAPRTASLGIHSPIGNGKNALGLLFTNDRIGVNQSNRLDASYAYHLKFNDNGNKLAIGLQATAEFLERDLASVDLPDGSDPQFSSIETHTIVNAGLGVYWYNNHFSLGAAALQLLPADINKSLEYTSFDEDIARQHIHYILSGGYVFELSSNVAFKPSFLMRYVDGAPLDFDISLGFHLVDRVWLGLTHRTGDAYIFGGAVQITESLRIGYAYDLTVSDLHDFNDGSHEAMIGFDLVSTKKGITNPRYLRYF